MTLIQTYRCHMYGQQQEPNEGYPWRTFTWVTRDSPTTEIVAGTSADKHSLVWWGTGHHYASTRQTTCLWMVKPRASTRGCGRMLNFHATPAGPGSWFWGGGPSPIALDFFNSVQTDDKDSSAHYEGLAIDVEPQGSSLEPGGGTRYHWTVIDLATWNAALASQSWLSLVLQITWGNLGLGTHGAVRAYLNGNNTPVVDVANINTHFLLDYRDDGSGNVPPRPPGGQELVSLWTGGYDIRSDNFSAAEFGSYDFTMPRLGNTVAEAVQDGTAWAINEFTHTDQSSVSTSGGASSNLEVLASVDTSLFQMPTVLGGGGPPPPPPPTGGTDQHTHRMSVAPNSTDLQSTLPNPKQFVYVYNASQTTQNLGTSSTRSIAWRAGDLYEGRKCWVLASFKPIAGREPGSYYNFHNNPLRGGWGDNEGNPVSPIHLFWYGDQPFTGTEGDGTSTPLRGLVLGLEANGPNGRKKWQVFSNAEMDAAIAAGTWIDIVMEITIGNPNGAVRIWTEGNDTPKVDTGTARTCYTWQDGVTLWEGCYNSSGTSGPITFDMVPTRIGRTLTEALQDGVNWPITEVNILGSVYASNQSVASWTHNVQTPRSTSLFQLPISLGGSGPGGGGDPPLPPPPENLNPLLVGFGDRTLPGSAVSGSYSFNSKRGVLCVSDGAYDLTSAWVYEAGVGTNGTVNQRGIISTSSGAAGSELPTTTLLTCNPVPVSAPTAYGWYEIPLPSTYRVDTGDKFFFSLQTDTGTGDCAINTYTDVKAGDRFVFKTDTYADGASDPWGTPTDTQAKHFLVFFSGTAVSPTDPDPPVTTLRIGGTRSGPGVRSGSDGHVGGVVPGGGI